MERARRAGMTALVGILALAAILAGSAVSARSPGVSVPAEPAAAVGWPPSTGLVIAEVVTGGASASDEWIELANAGATPLDLADLELAYVTSSGATITRKATWASTLLLDPGRHLLLANASGIHAAIADVTYTGGLAATGGALVVRPVGGTPIDAVGWGDAVNAFVEGAAAPAPPAGSSIERLPGGSSGHATDSNDNLSDFLVNPLPIAQDLDSPPTPEASPTPSPATSPSVGPSPAPSASASALPDPSGEPSLEPSPVPSASLVASPSPAPSLTPTPTTTAPPSPTPSPPPSATPDPSPSPIPTPIPSPSPTPEPSTAPSPSPSASPGPTTTEIGDVRAMADGATATIEGTLTTALGALESGRTGFVQDATGGIALYLDAAAALPLEAGSVIRVSGTVGERYGQRTLRITWADLAVIGAGLLPAPLARTTGTVGEVDEGRRLAIAGVIVDSPSDLADGIGLDLDDGSGPVRVIVTPDAAAGLLLVRGVRIEAVGPLGQRDSSGTGTTGYRIFATLPGEVTVVVDPSPSPLPSSSPSPSPSPSPTSSPAPSASPSPSPEPSGPAVDTIAAARTMPLGALVRVAGVVTAEPGRLGKPPLFAIEDRTAGIVIHLPDEVGPPARGDRVEVAGRLTAPYGQLEVRPEASGYRRLGTGSLPTPLRVAVADMGEGLEARLLRLDATVVSAPRRATSGDLTVDVADAAGAATRVMVDYSAGIAREAFVTGTRYTFIGVEGQRATRIGALDGYRIWLRGASDLRPIATSSPSPSPSPTATGSASPGSSTAPSPSLGPDASAEPAVLTITGALATSGVRVGIEATVTAGPALLDATGRRIVVQDPTGAIEVLMPDARAVRVGDRIRATGVVGTAYGAPRFRADAVSVIGRSTVPVPTDVSRAPDASLEWRLARVRGVVVDVRRMGDRWRAEIQVGGERVLVTGLPGAGVDAGRLPEGASATVVGIVRRPYPTATDRRFALVPRWGEDIATAAAGGGSGSSGGASAAGGSGSAGSAGGGSAAGGTSGGGTSGPGGGPGTGGPPRIDLGQLGEFRGREVQVGGLVVETAVDAVLIDDGTARAWLAFAPAAASLLADLVVGDAVSATGTVSGDPGAERVTVGDPSAVVLAAGLVAAPTAAATPAPADGARTGSAEGPTAMSGADPAADLVAPGAAGFAGLLAIVILAGSWRGRRWLERRRLATRIVARLASLTETVPAPEPAPSVAPAAVSVASESVTLTSGRSGAS